MYRIICTDSKGRTRPVRSTHDGKVIKYPMGEIAREMAEGMTESAKSLDIPCTYHAERIK
jgi:hypothetical protein